MPMFHKSKQDQFKWQVMLPTFLRLPLLYSLMLLMGFTLFMPSLEGLFRTIFPHLNRVIYQQTSFLNLLLSHVALVLSSTIISSLIGVTLGIIVTRKIALKFKAIVEIVAAIGQTFPPVAVLAIAAPLTGFGPTPAIIALVMYGLLPIIQSTITGLSQVPVVVTNSAKGIGMTGVQYFIYVELPLALPVILSGIRTSTIINVGTTAIASSAGVSTLGSPIFIGLSGFNNAYVLQGAIIVGLLAITIDQAFEMLQRKVIAQH